MTCESELEPTPEAGLLADARVRPGVPIAWNERFQEILDASHNAITDKEKQVSDSRTFRLLLIILTICYRRFRHDYESWPKISSILRRSMASS